MLCYVLDVLGLLDKLEIPTISCTQDPCSTDTASGPCHVLSVLMTMYILDVLGVLDVWVVAVCNMVTVCALCIDTTVCVCIV